MSRRAALELLLGEWPPVDLPVVCRVPGKAIGKGRPQARRRHGQVMLITPEATERGEAWVRQCWLDQCGQTLMIGPLALSVRIGVAVPRSWSACKQAQAFQGELMPTGKPDVDNVAKLVMDALNGIAWLDDVQVVDLQVSKRYVAAGEVGMWLSAQRVR